MKELTKKVFYCENKIIYEKTIRTINRMAYQI